MAIKGDIVPVLDPTSSSNFTGRSRGFETSALGTLFGDVAKTASSIIPAVDRERKTHIKEEIRTGVESTYETFFGGDNEVTTESDAKRSMPADAKREFNRIQAMRKKFQSGKITSTHYWTTLNAISKKVRSRYPGYADEIDNEFSRLTGNVPANALRREQLAIANAKAGSASKLLNKNMAFIEWAQKQGMVPTKLIPAAANLQQAAASPEFMAELRSSVSAVKGGEYRLAQEKNILESQNARNELDIDRTTKYYSERLIGVFKDTIRKTGLLDTVNQQKMELLKQSEAGKPVDLATQTELRANIAKLREALIARKNEIDVNTPGLSKITGKLTEVNKLWSSLMNTIEVGLEKKDYSSLSVAGQFLSDMNTYDEASLKAANATLRRLSAAKNSIGEQAVLYADKVSNNKIMTTSARLVSDYIIGRVAEGSSLVEAARMESEKPNAADGKGIDYAVDLVKGTFITKSDNPEGVRQVFDATFTPKNKDMLRSFSPAVVSKFYNDMTSEAAIKTFKAYVAEGTLNASDVANYQQYMFDTFNSVARPLVPEIEAVKGYGATVVYNQETGKVEVSPPPMPANTDRNYPFIFQWETVRDRAATVAKKLDPLFGGIDRVKALGNEGGDRGTQKILAMNMGITMQPKAGPSRLGGTNTGITGEDTTTLDSVQRVFDPILTGSGYDPRVISVYRKVLENPANLTEKDEETFIKFYEMLHSTTADATRREKEELASMLADPATTPEVAKVILEQLEMLTKQSAEPSVEDEKFIKILRAKGKEIFSMFKKDSSPDE